MSSEQAPATAPPSPAPTPATPRPTTARERHLATAQLWGILLVILGLANGVAGVVIGRRITQPAHDFLGEVSGTEISPTGVAFIGNAIAVGLILVILGLVVISFANALKPEPATPASGA